MHGRTGRRCMHARVGLVYSGGHGEWIYIGKQVHACVDRGTGAWVRHIRWEDKLNGGQRV